MGNISGENDLEWVHELLVRDCVRDSGYTIADPAPPPIELSGLPALSPLTLWGIRGESLGVSSALENPKTLAALRSGQSKDASHQEVAYPPGVEDIVYGSPRKELTIDLPGGNGGSVVIPVGGCFGDATSRLYGVPAEDFERTRFAVPKATDILRSAVTSNGVGAALPSYQECMKRGGVEVSDPSDLAEILGPDIEGVVRGEIQVTELSAKEKSLVALDKSCKVTSGLGTAYYESFISAASRGVESSQATVAEYSAMTQHALQVASERARSGPGVATG